MEDGVPEHGDTRLEECQDVALGSCDAGIDVVFIFGEEGCEVGLVDPCRALLRYMTFSCRVTRKCD